MTTRLPDSAHGRLAWSVVGGVVVAIIVAALTDALLGVLSGIASTATTFDVTGWWALWPIDAESGTRRLGRQQITRPESHNVSRLRHTAQAWLVRSQSL